MKHNTDPIHSESLRRALQSLPPTDARLSSNFTWRTMQAIYDVDAIRRRRQDRNARIVAIAAAIIAGAGALTLAIWLCYRSIGSALESNLAEVGRSFNTIPPAMIAPAITFPLLIVADRLLRRAYFRHR